MLADVVEDIVDRHNLDLTRGQQEAVSEQRHLFTLRKVRKVVTGGSLHNVADGDGDGDGDGDDDDDDDDADDDDEDEDDGDDDDDDDDDV